jgi:hypothetical protein
MKPLNCPGSGDVSEYEAISRGVYPYARFATRMISGQYMALEGIHFNCGDILRGKDGKLYFILGTPFWQGSGVPDDLDLAYSNHLSDGSYAFYSDAFVGVECEISEGKVTFMRQTQGNFRNFFSSPSGYDHLPSIEAAFGDPFSSVDWEAVMQQVSEHYVINSSLFGFNEVDREAVRRRGHRLRVLLHKKAMASWGDDWRSRRAQALLLSYPGYEEAPVHAHEIIQLLVEGYGMQREDFYGDPASNFNAAGFGYGEKARHFCHPVASIPGASFD